MESCKEYTNSAALNDLETIEKKALHEYIEENDLRGEIENVMKSFFDKNRQYLPENPYPEITKRFRQIEVRVRWKKCLEIVDKNLKLFHSSGSTVTKLVPMKLFNRVLLSCSRPPVTTNKQNDEDDEEDKQEEISSTKGRNSNESEDYESSNAEEPMKVYGLEHVMNGVTDIYWIESICNILKEVLSPIETMMDQSYLNKISLISSPVFFYDSYQFLHKLSGDHVLYSHLFPRHNNKCDSWPYFLLNGQIEMYNHVGITSATFQKALSVFAKFIQQQIYWISVRSKQSAQYRFFFKHLIINCNDNNAHLWTFDEMKRKRKNFETNIKHAVAQKHSIRMIFYFIAPDDTLIFECECYWYFYFRDIKCIKISTASSKRRGTVQDYHWTSFSTQSYHCVYHSVFVHYDDIRLFIDFFKHLTFDDAFELTQWRLKEWKRIIHNLDNMDYSQIMAYLYRLVILVNDVDNHKQIVSEMRLTLYGQSQLFQGFMHCIHRVMSVLHIVYKEIKERCMDQQQEDVDHRMSGQWIHKAMVSISNRFKEISDFYYPLYSEYLYCIPRIKYLLIQSVELLPSWVDLSKTTNNIQRISDECLNEIKEIFDLIGDTLVRGELSMCTSTRQWIQEQRQYLKCAPPNIAYTPTNNILIIQEAMDNNQKGDNFPNSILLEGTLLQYAVDTEMDIWFTESLFKVLSNPLVFNPFIKIVMDAQQMCFQFDSYKQTDCIIYEQIMNIDDIKLVSVSAADTTTDIQHLYTFDGVYGYKSALLFINCNLMKDLHKDICEYIPTKIMTGAHYDEEDIPDYNIFLSFCGDITYYPYFNIALHEMEIVQNVFICGYKFDEIVEIFACHCWNLSHYLFKSCCSVIFMSLIIGNNKYQCDMIIKKSNYQNALKMLIQAAKSRQSIVMELLVASSIVKKYVSVKLNIFLIYYETTTNRYRLCWPFRSDIIFTSIFFDVADVIKFWSAYSVGNIPSEYNLEHKDYKKELIHKLQTFESCAEFDGYLHCVLRLKALTNDYNGIVEIYRFYEESTMCGKCIQLLKQLISIQNLLNYQKISRYIKNQMNRQMIARQMQESIAYLKQIILSDLLTFFDRSTLRFVRTYHDLENASNDEIYTAFNQMIKLLIPVKNACTMAWKTWLVSRNKNILVQKVFD